MCNICIGTYMHAMANTKQHGLKQLSTLTQHVLQYESNGIQSRVYVTKYSLSLQYACRTKLKYNNLIDITRLLILCS